MLGFTPFNGQTVLPSIEQEHLLLEYQELVIEFGSSGYVIALHG
ncbi:hypothetical protein [Yersinia sp. 2466 StPb PI]